MANINHNSIHRQRQYRNLRSCVSDRDWPGASTVKAEGSVDFAASMREYLTLTPVKSGLEPSSVVMSKVLVGRTCSAPRGSLRSLRVSSPVLVTVATTLNLSTPSTASGPVTFRERPGAAEAPIAEATSAINTERRAEENIRPIACIFNVQYQDELQLQSGHTPRPN